MAYHQSRQEKSLDIQKGTFVQKVTVEVEVVVASTSEIGFEMPVDHLRDAIEAEVQARLGHLSNAAATLTSTLPGQSRFFFPGEDVVVESDQPVKVDLKVLGF